MKLAALQRQVARAVMAPLTRSERMRRVAPDGEPMAVVANKIIKPNDRLTSIERLEIYNRQYWFRVLDALSDDFPGLRSVLGDRRFDALAKCYLTDCPSRSFTMRDIGSRLESWLRKHPRYARGRLQLALDMVRLEWAEIEAFDGASEPPVTAAVLVGADPAELRLRLQPYIRLLDLRFPVDNLLLAIKHDAPADVASNAMEERQKRKKVSAVACLKPVPVYLAIHRMENTVYFRRLDREEFTILFALHQGRTLERAIVAAFRSSKIPAEERASTVAAWFQNWASLGWFVSSERPTQ
jgi:Putative DNA-binding domain